MQSKCIMHNSSQCLRKVCAQIPPIRRVSVVTQVPILGPASEVESNCTAVRNKKLLHFSVSQVHSQNYHLVCADTAVHIPDLFSPSTYTSTCWGHTQLKARFTQLLQNLKTIELPGRVELSIQLSAIVHCPNCEIMSFTFLNANLFAFIYQQWQAFSASAR